MTKNKHGGGLFKIKCITQSSGNPVGAVVRDLQIWLKQYMVKQTWMAVPIGAITWMAEDSTSKSITNYHFNQMSSKFWWCFFINWHPGSDICCQLTHWITNSGDPIMWTLRQREMCYDLSRKPCALDLQINHKKVNCTICTNQVCWTQIAIRHKSRPIHDVLSQPTLFLHVSKP